MVAVVLGGMREVVAGAARTLLFVLVMEGSLPAGAEEGSTPQRFYETVGALRETPSQPRAAAPIKEQESGYQEMTSPLFIKMARATLGLNKVVYKRLLASDLFSLKVTVGRDNLL